MNFKDIFKSDFLEAITSVNVADMAITLILAFGLGMFIFLVYKKTYGGVMYSSGFGVTLVALTMITATVILAVTSNVVLSLGMVGALSIVRFRTAIKEPLDIAFLFWSIGVGIVLLVLVNKKGHARTYIAVIRCEDSETESAVRRFLDGKTKRCAIKSKTVQKGDIELNLELSLKDDNTDFINETAEMNGVKSAVLVSYNGDYTG